MNKILDIEQIKLVVNRLVDFIKPTYGPVGNKIILSNDFGHRVLDDGFTIANEFSLENDEDAIIKVIKEASQKTNSRVGDGTTGSLILLQALMNQKIDPVDLYTGLNEAKEELKSSAKLLTTKEELKGVAQMAYNNSEIAEVIADLVFKLGCDGVITIEESPNLETKSEVVEGMRFDQGFISPYMVTNQEKMEAVMLEPYILVTDQKISLANQLLPILEEMVKANKKDLVIIADDVTGEALTTLVINKLKGTFNSLAIKAPSFGDRKVQMLEDIAITTGAELVSQQKGTKLGEITLEMLGKAKKVICGKENTIIVEGYGEKEKIEERVAQISNTLSGEVSEFDKSRLQERFAKLTKGIGIIKVGGTTESEMKAAKYKVEDAVNATKIAYKSGVVQGGGKALSAIETSSEALNNALKVPEEVLIENGTKFSEIYDPVEVLIASLESAVSIVLLLNSTKGVIYKEKKDDQRI